MHPTGARPVPNRYVKSLPAAEQRRQNLKDIQQHVTRTLVNAGRLLDKMANPRVDLKWEPSNHEKRKNSRAGDRRHYRQYRQALKQELTLRLDRSYRPKQMTAETRDRAIDAAEAGFGTATGIQPKGLRKVVLEAKAQEVIANMVKAGAITDRQHAMLQSRQQEKLDETRRALNEEKQKLEQRLQKLPSELIRLDKVRAKSLDAIKNLEPQAGDARSKVEAWHKALEDKAVVHERLKTALQTLLESRTPAKKNAHKAGPLQRLMEDAFEDTYTLPGMLNKSEAERNEALLAAEVEKLKRYQQNLVKEHPEEAPSPAEQAYLAKIESESRKASAAAEALQSDAETAQALLRDLESAKEQLTSDPVERENLKFRAQETQERLNEIAAESSMTTSFVSLSALDRLECLGRDAHLDLLAGIGREWIKDDLVCSENKPRSLPQMPVEDPSSFDRHVSLFPTTSSEQQGSPDDERQWPDRLESLFDPQEASKPEPTAPRQHPGTTGTPAKVQRSYTWNHPTEPKLPGIDAFPQ